MMLSHPNVRLANCLSVKIRQHDSGEVLFRDVAATANKERIPRSPTAYEAL
jgi:hypothetical protein